MKASRVEINEYAGFPGRAGFTAIDSRGPAMETEVLEGLKRTPKAIPPKYLYDAEGSRLFELICELPAYYLTRAETA